MRYRNVDVELYDFEQQDDRESFSVRVTNSPAGDQSPSQAERITLPPGLRPEAGEPPVLIRRNMPGEFDDLIAYGETLADCLLPSSVRYRLLESMRLLKEDEAVRLRLKFDAWQLADLPWECIYIARSTGRGASREIDGFCALDRRISIARYEYSDYPLISFEPEDTTNLRQLVLLASQDQAGFAHLYLDEEARSISELLRSVTNLSIEFLNDPTIEKVQEALEHPAHLFHFAGHGGFSPFSSGRPGAREGKGYILLCQSTGGAPVPLPAEKLALNLARCGVRIALLNSSSSASRSPVRRLSGVASALAYAGIPAVIGYSGEIADLSAIAFTKAFYRTLAAGNPVDTAVTNGRLAIFNQSEDLLPGWGSPVLYLRTDDSTIFPIRPKPQKTPDRRLSMPSSLTLRDILVKQFDVNELRLLCADITGALNRDGIQQRVDLEIVGGNTLETYALNLIQHLERRGLLSYLVEAATAERPNLFQTAKD